MASVWVDDESLADENENEETPLYKKPLPKLEEVKKLLSSHKSFDTAFEAFKKQYSDTLCYLTICDLMTRHDDIKINHEGLPDEYYEYKPFIPTMATRIFEQNNAWWYDVSSTNAANNFIIRSIRASGVISVPIIFLILSTLYFDKLNLAAVIGTILLFMFTGYFSIILYYVLSVSDDKKLYRIYSTSRKVDKWANFNIGHVQILMEKQSIQSISELSAIHGGVTKTMLNALGAYTWCAVLIHFLSQLYYNDQFTWDISDCFALIGTIGLLLISIYELDPFNKCMKGFHYLGAALGTGTIFAYNMQQYSIGEKLPFAIIIFVMAAISFVLWQLTNVATSIAQPQSHSCSEQRTPTGCTAYIVLCVKDKKQLAKIHVNTYSKLNVVFEAIFLYLGAFSLCLWLIEFNKQCEWGCSADPSY